MSTLRTKECAWIVVLGLLLALFLGACAEKQVPLPPTPTWPSIVTSDEGVQYYVSGLRIPGTRQEIRTRKDEANLWISLSQISGIRFTTPVFEDYRAAEIVLVSGETLRVKVEANQIMEGRTEAGYWNMPLSKIYSLELGTQ
jgi:hypothetical protein